MFCFFQGGPYNHPPWKLLPPPHVIYHIQVCKVGIDYFRAGQAKVDVFQQKQAAYGRALRGQLEVSVRIRERG